MEMQQFFWHFAWVFYHRIKEKIGFFVESFFWESNLLMKGFFVLFLIGFHERFPSLA
jgi:hypothetical protein